MTQPQLNESIGGQVPIDLPVFPNSMDTGFSGPFGTIKWCPSSDDLRPIRYFENGAIAHSGAKGSRGNNGYGNGGGDGSPNGKNDNNR